MDTENQKVDTDIAVEEDQEFITDIAETDIEKEKDREKEIEAAKERARKRRLIPPFVMLLAGAIVSITMYMLHYEVKTMLIVLVCVLVAFYMIGDTLRWMLNRFEAQNEEARMEEGEVIEKELDEEDQDTVTENRRETDGE
ncbi:MAG: hypothetical protein J1F41_05320 [Lachnospiraceae bacterium]|nr:hypothetical protein [Lachnospiraceae bacterium]